MFAPAQIYQKWTMQEKKLTVQNCLFNANVFTLICTETKLGLVSLDWLRHPAMWGLCANQCFLVARLSRLKSQWDSGDFGFRGQEVFLLFFFHWTWDLWTLKRCLRHLCRPDFSHLYQVNCCILVYHVWSCLCNVTSLLQSYSLTIFHVVCCLH